MALILQINLASEEKTFYNQVFLCLCHGVIKSITSTLLLLGTNTSYMS